VVAFYHVLFDSAGWYSKNLEALGLRLEDLDEGPGFWAGVGNSLQSGGHAIKSGAVGGWTKTSDWMKGAGSNLKGQMAKIHLPKPSMPAWRGGKKHIEDLSSVGQEQLQLHDAMVRPYSGDGID